MMKAILVVVIVVAVLCLLLYISCCYLFQVGMVAEFQRKPPKKKRPDRPPTPEQLRIREASQAAESWRREPAL